MSSFLFLHFCDDALRLLGLYFSAFHPFKTFLRWFLPPPSKPPRGPHTASTGRVRSFPGVVPLPGPQNRTQGCTGPSFGFLSRTSLPLPLKGEGLVLAQLEVLRFCWIRPQLAHTSPTGPVWCCAGIWYHSHNGLTRLQRRGFGVLLVSHTSTRFPNLHTGPHRAEFGFRLLTGASQEDFPLFRQSRIRTQAEEKNTSAPLF